MNRSALVPAFLIGLVMSGCGTTTEVDGKGEPTSLSAAVASWLPLGDHVADIMDSVVYPPRMIELTNRFRDSVASHHDWFIDALGKVKEGEPMAYHPNMGMTVAEYAEFSSFKDSVISFSSGQARITIGMEDSIIEFHGTGRLDLLDMIKIDLKQNVAYISNVLLPTVDTIAVADSSNSLRSAWRGYSWRYDYPENMDPQDLRNLDSLTIIHYRVLVGRIARTGKSYLSIEMKEIRDGVKEMNFELPVTF